MHTALCVIRLSICMRLLKWNSDMLSYDSVFCFMFIEKAKRIHLRHENKRFERT